MVNLTRIYTRTGDDGITRLANNAPTRKTDPRLETVGAIDEANCSIGVALTLDPPSDAAKTLGTLQNELFDLGADLSMPMDAEPCPLRIDGAAVQRLEALCDRFSAGLPSLQSFLLPGGSPLAAQLGVARTIVRRAERAAWRANDEVAGGLNPQAIRYLNRLSDLLFIMARHVNQQVDAQEVLWVPGADRN